MGQCRNRNRLMAALLGTLGIVIAMGAQAANLGSYDQSAAYNQGYGGGSNMMSSPSIRDENGNLSIVNGVIASSNYSQMSDVSSHNSGGNASATAIGNSLNVQVQGTWNTVIVNSKQENNGDQTANASLNGKLDM